MKGDTIVHDLIMEPQKYETKELSHLYIFNRNAIDFGYEFTDIQ